ncbi:hypothetical protein GOP47_0026322 [Adiantum capillus-veneris]|nr:hypothetical protein GOP47_0026322 [Adiantum capillus-veneris]
MAVKCLREHPLWALHVTYFFVLSLIGALVLWAGGQKEEPLAFLDAFYNAVSAVTETGLASVPIHRFSLCNQITLLLLMVVGGQVFTSAIPLFLRKLYFFSTPIPQKPSDCEIASHPHAAKTYHGGSSPSPAVEIWSIFPYTGDYHMQTQKKAMDYEALVTVSWLTACYHVFFISTGFIICQICVVRSPHAFTVLTQNQVNPGLFSIFATVSAFGNCGYILLDANMVPLQQSWVILLCLGTLMLMGNTLYAPTLRFGIWVLYRSTHGKRKEVCAYILASKERCFSHIFPSDGTFWLVGSVVFWNGCQVICMLAIDWRSEALKGLGAGYKLVVALFQSISARTGGMNAVNLSGFSAPTLFIALVAMYVASYPIHISKHPARKCKGNIFMGEIFKLRRKDSFLFVATFLICFFERDSLRHDPLNFSFFNIIYEVISAYGNVGLTIGYSCSLKTIMAHTTECLDIPCAFSGKWTFGGKAVLILVMLFGRHRNLLEDIDWDIISPLNISS